MTSFRSRHRLTRALLALACLPLGATSALAAAPSWGAIATRPGGYGYAFNQSSRDAA